MVRSVESAPARGLEPAELAHTEIIDDIFFAAWKTESEPLSPTQEGESFIQEKEPSLEAQLESVEQVRESYAEFQMAVAAAGSSLMSLFMSCGAACIAHGHGLIGGLGNGFSLDLSGLGHLSHDHDHDHDHDHKDEVSYDQDWWQSSAEPVAEKPKVKKTKQPSSPVKKYLPPSDLALFFLSSAVRV